MGKYYLDRFVSTEEYINNLIKRYIKNRLENRGWKWEELFKINYVCELKDDNYEALVLLAKEYEDEYFHECFPFKVSANVYETDLDNLCDGIIFNKFLHATTWDRIIRVFSLSGALAIINAKENSILGIETVIEWAKFYINNNVLEWMRENGGVHYFIELKNNKYPSSSTEGKYKNYKIFGNFPNERHYVHNLCNRYLRRRLVYLGTSLDGKYPTEEDSYDPPIPLCELFDPNFNALEILASEFESKYNRNKFEVEYDSTFEQYEKFVAKTLKKVEGWDLIIHIFSLTGSVLGGVYVWARINWLINWLFILIERKIEWMETHGGLCYFIYLAEKKLENMKCKIYVE